MSEKTAEKVEKNGKAYSVIDSGYVRNDYNRVITAVTETENGSDKYMKLMQVQDDVAFTVPGEDGEDVLYTVDKGGYLEIDDEDIVSGLSEKEFNETYSMMYEDRVAVDKDIYENWENTPFGDRISVNVDAITSRLEEHGVKVLNEGPVYVDYSGLSRDEKYRFGVSGDEYQRVHLTAELPNGIRIGMYTDNIPDRAVITEFSREESEMYRNEDLPKPNHRAESYLPDVAFDLRENEQQSVGDIVRAIENVASCQERTYADVITASVQKYFPARSKEIEESVLVRDPSADEMRAVATRDGYSGRFDLHYSPHMTVFAPESGTMTKEETAALVAKFDTCRKIGDGLKNLSEKADVMLRKLAYLDPHTQDQRVEAVKSCQKFLDTIENSKSAMDKEVDLADMYSEYNDDKTEKEKEFPKTYYELAANRNGLTAALIADSAKECSRLRSVTETYKKEFMEKAEERYDEEHMDEPPERYRTEDDYESFDIANDMAEESYHNDKMYCKKLPVAPVSYIIETQYVDSIRHVQDMQKDISKKIITQLAADTQGVTHDDVSRNFGSYAVKDLDSVQLLKSREGQSMIQLTASKDRYFNAVKVQIPAEEFDDPASAVSAAAKYSQTKKEFESEMPDVTYDDAYVGRGQEYVEEAEELGNVRYDSEIDREAAAGIIGVQEHEPEPEPAYDGSNRHSGFDERSSRDDYDMEL